MVLADSERSLQNLVDFWQILTDFECLWSDLLENAYTYGSKRTSLSGPSPGVRLTPTPPKNGRPDIAAPRNCCRALLRLSERER